MAVWSKIVDKMDVNCYHYDGAIQMVKRERAAGVFVCAGGH